MTKLVTFSLAAGLALAIALPSRGEVVSSDKHGFSLKSEISTGVPVERAYGAFVEEIGKWWDGNHTFSRDASNLYIEAKPKGWFGEKLPEGGFVRHMEVGFLAPNRVVRLLGGLGPLQELGLHGALTVRFARVEEKTKVTLTYNVSGYHSGGLDKLAPLVDSVLAQQLTRLQSYLETGRP